MNGAGGPSGRGGDELAGARACGCGANPAPGSASVDEAVVQGCGCATTKREDVGAQSGAEAERVTHLLVRSARLVQELHRLQERYGVVWERVRVDGQEVRPSGPPFVYQADLGMFSPLDDEHAALPDALYRREDADWVDRDGRRWSVQRLLRVPRIRGPSPLPVAVAASPQRAAPAATRAGAQASGGERGRWTLRLDEAPAERIPARGQCGAAWTDWGSADRLLPLRRERAGAHRGVGGAGAARPRHRCRRPASPARTVRARGRGLAGRTHPRCGCCTLTTRGRTEPGVARTRRPIRSPAPRPARRPRPDERSVAARGPRDRHTSGA